MWSALFSFVNIVAIAAWLVLAAAPRTPLVYSVILYLGVALLCLVYTVFFALVTTGQLDPAASPGAGQPGFGSLAEVQAIFQSQGGALIGWTHYLAFDLFVGLWISRDADAKGFGRLIQLPFLFATFMAGPIGLFAWLIVRERAARRTAKGQV
ncbi:MAG: ABA4-like family protein [Novosphingobium sp.]|uniref:ABA4-like family protein n=1 Tax=Novosphingobium sp. TaxID=1874826 RepID=UPI0032BD4C7B